MTETDDPLLADLQPLPPRAVRLKSGERADVRVAAAEWRVLNALAGTDPHLFAAAVELAHARPVSPEVSGQLRQFRLTTAAGHLRPVLAAVLRSGYQLTPDGPVVVSPFDPETEADRAAVREVERVSDANLERLRRHLFRGRPGADPGPGGPG